jgi:MFS family permease
MAAGGFFFFPLSHKIGRSSAIFWSLLFLLLAQVWASLMVHSTDFKGFIVSRFFGGALGTIAGVLGPRILVDMFFLHQRGRAFTVFHWCFDFGTVAGPTISVCIFRCHLPVFTIRAFIATPPSTMECLKFHRLSLFL